jgi:hypothetical protein
MRFFGPVKAVFHDRGNKSLPAAWSAPCRRCRTPQVRGKAER